MEESVDLNSKMGDKKNWRKVKLIEKYRSKLPFGVLASRNATAVILSFYGDRLEVNRLMQCLNNTSRAYFVNADQLKGFLVGTIAQIISETTEAERLQICRYQFINFSQVEEHLECCLTND